MKLLVILWTVMFAQSSFANLDQILHIDINGTRAEYDQLYKTYVKNRMLVLNETSPSPLRDMDEIVELGRRNLEWLDHLNLHRGEGQEKLAFSSKATQRGIPMESPKEYGPSTIYPTYDELLANFPEQMTRVLVDGQTFENSLEIEDDVYIEYGRQLHGLYQTTVRWMSLYRWRRVLAERKTEDVRGYFNLSQRENLEAELNGFSELSDDLKQNFAMWLTNLCENSESRWRSCGQMFNTAKTNNQLMSFYSRYRAGGERQWNQFFRLDVRRSDTHWHSDQEMRFPFKTPERMEVQEWLTENIEDEWQWEDWKLTLEYSARARAHVVFRPNVTPNVNGLGGNRITMNSLMALDDYNTSWTIRHEFGHVLGFPDCYIEFFDEDRNLFVNYQIDTTNLMCSRTGELKATHYEELKRVYKDR